MWPENPNKYTLIRDVIKNPEKPWKPLTYWGTVIKNLQQTYKLLIVSRTDERTEDGYYIRESNNFIKHGLLKNNGEISEAGDYFIKYTQERLDKNPDFLNRKNVNPFELEYLFHKLLYKAGDLNVFNNLQELFKLVPDIHTDDSESIVSVVAINNGKETLKKFNSLDNENRKKLFEEIISIHAEMKASGGKIKVNKIVRPDWEPYLKLLSVGSLGNQNDGYYRAASLLRAHILLLSLISLENKKTASFEELYIPFRNNIEKDSFRELLYFESEIEETENGYKHTPNREIIFEEIFEEDVKEEIRKIKYDTLTLTEEERLEKIKSQLRSAEKTPVITVPKGQGKRRVTFVRHVRDPKTSASMRLYYKDMCQLCGFDGNSKYGIGIVEVDHVIDEIADTQNNRPSNLIVLCPNCHAAKTKRVLQFMDEDDHFIVKNTFTGETRQVDKIDLSE